MPGLGEVTLGSGFLVSKIIAYTKQGPSTRCVCGSSSGTFTYFSMDAKPNGVHEQFFLKLETGQVASVCV